MNGRLIHTPYLVGFKRSCGKYRERRRGPISGRGRAAGLPASVIMTVGEANRFSSAGGGSITALGKGILVWLARFTVDKVPTDIQAPEDNHDGFQDNQAPAAGRGRSIGDADVTGDTKGDGVRFSDASGTQDLVHEYMGDDYSLEDICVLFGLGMLEQENDEEVVLVLSDSEVRSLKAMADAQSFDHPEGFIRMCLDIHGFVAGRNTGPYRFHADA